MLPIYELFVLVCSYLKFLGHVNCFIFYFFLLADIVL